MNTVMINRFSLSVEGLILNYTYERVTTNLILDACATTDLFQNMGFIEDFVVSNEPVVLFTDLKEGQPITGYSTWCDFVKTFPMTRRMAEMIAEYREGKKLNNKMVDQINALLSPLELEEAA